MVTRVPSANSGNMLMGCGGGVFLILGKNPGRKMGGDCARGRLERRC